MQGDDFFAEDANGTADAPEADGVCSGCCNNFADFHHICNTFVTKVARLKTFSMACMQGNQRRRQQEKQQLQSWR